MNITGKPKLFIPGPTHVDEEILNAFTEYPVGHRTSLFSELYDNLVSGIQKVLFTDNRIYLCTCTAQVFGKLLFETPLKKGVLILFAALFLAAGMIPLLCAVFPQMPYMWNLVKL